MNYRTETEYRNDRQYVIAYVDDVKVGGIKQVRDGWLASLIPPTPWMESFEDPRDALNAILSETLRDLEPAKCVECGHLHFYPAIADYGPCPLYDAGCECRGQA